MKKIFIFLIAFLIISFNAKSQSLQFLYNGDGTTVTGDPNDFDIESFADFKNISNSTKIVFSKMLVEKIATQDTLTQQVTFCYGKNGLGKCYEGQTKDFWAPDSVELKPGESLGTQQFIAKSFPLGVVGSSCAKYYFYIKGFEQTDYISYGVCFNATTTDVMIDDSRGLQVLNFKNSVKIESPIQENFKLSVYNILGEIVYNLSNVNSNSDIDLSFLPSGNYFMIFRDVQNNFKKSKISISQ